MIAIHQVVSAQGLYGLLLPGSQLYQHQFLAAKNSILAYKACAYHLRKKIKKKTLQLLINII